MWDVSVTDRGEEPVVRSVRIANANCLPVRGRSQCGIRVSVRPASGSCRNRSGAKRAKLEDDATAPFRSRNGTGPASTAPDPFAVCRLPLVRAGRSNNHQAIRAYDLRQNRLAHIDLGSRFNGSRGFSVADCRARWCDRQSRLHFRRSFRFRPVPPRWRPPLRPPIHSGESPACRH